MKDGILLLFVTIVLLLVGYALRDLCGVAKDIESIQKLERQLSKGTS